MIVKYGPLSILYLIEKNSVERGFGSDLLPNCYIAARLRFPYLACMHGVIKEIYARKLAIKKEIDGLDEENRLWRLSEPLQYNYYILTPDDVVNKRTAHKFAVLGQVVKHLTKNAYNRQSGASASDIYRHIKRDFPTMSPSTFRSQLTRFKIEGRLTYDQQNGMWNLAKRKEVAP